MTKQGGAMEYELKGALKKYRRMRGWRQFGMYAAAVFGLSVPWLMSFGQTDTLICYAGTLVFVLGGQIEMRLKTIQIRLAGMADEIDELSRKEPENNLVLELNDW
jgi:hypothetical protein